MIIKNNNLYVEKCNTVDLANEYGTPLYILSESYIEDKIKEIEKDFLDKYKNTRVAYAGKAFLTLYMCELIEKKGLNLDIVSGGELFTAIKAGFPAERIEFNGNNKSIEELEMAIDYNVGRFIVDNIYELDLLIELSKLKNKNINILFRITPGVNSDTHKFITTGNKDSKFGIPLNEDIIFPNVKKAINSDNINFHGFHYHIGSQLHDNSSHIKALNISLELIKKIKDKFKYEVKELNVGGGFGIKYTDKDKVKPISYFVDPIMNRIKKFCCKENIKMLSVVIEPGRFIVGEAGIQLYKIGSIKEIPDLKTYVSVDGGMTDNIRPGLYNAEYNCILANRANEKKIQEFTICGKCCESTDILINNIKLPYPKSGDILAVFSTGAYGYSMANNYNKLPIPPVVVVKGNNSKIIVKGQNYKDIIEREVFS